MATPSLLSLTRVVLVHPFYPENVGSVARAMANCGLERLVVADPGPALPDHPHALKLAVHAEAILDHAVVAPSLEQAVAGSSLVVGMSRHPYEGVRPILPREAAQLAARHAAGGGEVAIVFGNEKNGLTREELRRCHQIVCIPTHGEQASLNLSQAVMIVAYEWLLASREALPAEGSPMAALTAESSVANVAGDLVDALQAGGFFKPHNRSHKEAVIRRVLSRAILDPEEASLFRGLVQRLGRMLSQLPPASEPEA